MAVRLTERQIRYAVLQCTKGAKTTATVAGELGVTQRLIQQLCARFRGTGEVPVPRSES